MIPKLSVIIPGPVSLKLVSELFCALFLFPNQVSSLLLILSNDVELNPCPKKDSSKRNFSIAHWNLNSIAAQNFVKLSQLEAYNTLHSYDLICLSETWLNSLQFP